MSERLSHRVWLARCSRVGALAAAAAVAGLLALGGVLGAPAPAHAAGRVDVSPAPSADGATTVTLSGSGFQYLPNAPGGIYVTFGVVSDPTTNAWAPSQGGKSGSTFGYAATGGTTLLVGFAGGSSADASNALIDESGNWSAQMTIPGSSFASVSGNPHAGGATEGATIDCLSVQCGIITFGAHGNVNANNESFTPVSFVTADGGLASGTAGQDFSQAAPDAATSLELPSASAGAGTADQPAAVPGSADDAAATEVVAGTAGTAADAQDTTPAQATQTDSGISSSTLVLGVLGFACVVLVAAVVVALLRRRRAAGPGSTANAGEQAPSPGQAPTAAEAAMPQDIQQTQVHAAASAVRQQEGAL
ncbi:hypothetical protein EDF60_3027 [Leucobacter luti]|uniref:hypothetical protein n=1 Tax=Leucobacter luti TaxID=340320 RepID=UPI0010521DB3|nr:hypothetical protein [Leucobacter luti]MCW2289814.1 hypothetical protein [Leucobacter luti]TCK34350.1 hypothetical protein EDF60_3027 [Leucobacter luti]